MRATLLLIRLHEVGLSFESASGWQVYDPSGRRKYLNADERRRFLAAADKEPASVRALCYFLVYCGCRVSEALHLERDQIDNVDGGVILRTLKRRRIVFRRVPLPHDIVAALLEIAPSAGRVWRVHRVTAWRWTARVMDEAGIAGPMACCRGTRHGFAIHDATKRVPPNLLQKWMGHASIETPAIYLDAVGMEERNFAERMW